MRITGEQLDQRIQDIESAGLDREETIKQMAEAVREYLDQYRMSFALRSAIRIANPGIELPPIGQRQENSTVA